MPQLLRRQESNKLFQTYWEESSQSPRRAYYRITPAGRVFLKAYIQQILSLHSPNISRHQRIDRQHISATGRF